MRPRGSARSSRLDATTGNGDEEGIRSVKGTKTTIGVPIGQRDHLTTVRGRVAPGRPIRSATYSAERTMAASPRPVVGPLPTAATAALVGMFVLALFAILYVARAFVLPIVLAMHLALLLSPAVRALRRIGLPEPVGAALILIGVLAAVGAGFYALATPTATWMGKFPESVRIIEQRIRIRKPVEAVRQAAEQVEKITAVDSAEKQAPVVQVKNRDAITTVLSGAHTVLAGLVVIILTLYFLLASGNLLLRKLIRVLPSLANKKRAVEIARETQRQISAYLLTITLINALLAAVLGSGFWVLGLPNPVLWAAMVFALNFAPFVGPIAGIIILSVVAVVTFPSVGQAVIVPALYFILHNVETNIITPLVLARRLTLNPVVMFVWLSLWFWIWGIPGALLAVPMLQTLKIFCDNIPQLAPIGQLLGR
jgi:predicted PurR-regulated permease PerM